MPHDANTLLTDECRAAQLILRFTAGRSLADYGTDFMLHSAVEHPFIIIGEALSRLDKLDSALTGQMITDCRKIIDFRNVLVHGYDAIDDRIVWQVIQQGLPVLARQVESLFAGLPSPQET